MRTTITQLLWLHTGGARRGTLLARTQRFPILFLALLSIPSAAFPDIVLSDTMNKGSRTDDPTSSGAQWFTMGPATAGAATTYAPNELKVTTGTAGGQLLGYLTASGSPVSLAVGQSVTVTFTFSLTGGLEAAGSTSLRFGLFNSGGGRISADITTLSSSSTFSPYTGYAAMFSASSDSTLTLRTRVPNAASNKENLIGTATTVYTAAHVSVTSQALAADVDYTGTLTATLTEAGLEYRINLAGQNLSNYTASFVDSSSSKVTNFDSFAAGWGTSSFTTSAGAIVIKSLTVDAPVAAADLWSGSWDATGRPFIWVRGGAERDAILLKIAGVSWASAAKDTLVSRATSKITSHQSNRDTFLRGLPVVDWSATTPIFKTMPTYASSEVRTPAVSMFDFGVDAAVLFYLTKDLKYARAAGDILHNAIKTMSPVTASTDTVNGGLIVQNDLLLEARIIGTQLPIIYDFLYKYLQERTTKVYDVKKANEVRFDFTAAQQLFRRYYQLARDHGYKGINWSALESTCMLNNLLALDDATERATCLDVFLYSGSDWQASLDYDYRVYSTPDNIWPESLQYAAAVVEIRSTQLVLLERYDSSLHLFDAYPNYALSLTRPSYLRYPNGEQISFGDGHRAAEGESFFQYEAVYQHAKARGRTDLVALFGARINDGINKGAYNRTTLRNYDALGMHNEILQLLWFADSVPEAGTPIALPRTDALPYAGITLQRNPAPANNPLYGLMGFVGGGAYIHSHATGMSMEIFGMGQVLGAKGGRLEYKDTITNNYYRVFASNNTIIVNGASRGLGGFASVANGSQGFDINQVQSLAMEPEVNQPAVSSNHSFSTSYFRDDKGSGAEASQQRTLGIVRTSATTGYYVDIFRSASDLANEFHDYVYHNVGDSVTLTANGAPLPLVSDPNRFQSDIGDYNQQPGWRYFTNTEVSASTDETVRAVFSANLPAGPTHMQMIMPGATGGREYARVSSPAITDAPVPYNTMTAPTLVIRKTGSAWNHPFAAVYEPYLGNAESGSVKTVSKIEKAGVVVGLKAESSVGSRNIVQYVLSNPKATDTYEDSALGLSFSGRYAVATDNGDGTGSLYMGEGSSLSLKGYTIASVGGANTQASLEFVDGQTPVLTANSSVTVTLPSYVTWRKQYFSASEISQPSISGPTAVLTSDGLSNLMKYALGLDPKVAAISGLPVLSAGATEWIFLFECPSSVTDVVYTVQSTTDLVNWSAVGAQLELVSDTTGKRKWRVRVPYTSAPTTLFRLSVTL